MKKTVLALCSALVIFAGNVLTPMTISAAERSCPPHSYNSEVPGATTLYSTHPYFIKNGPDGPVYGTCTVSSSGPGVFRECGACGYVDYLNPIEFHPLVVTHSSCGQ